MIRGARSVPWLVRRYSGVRREIAFVNGPSWAAYGQSWVAPESRMPLSLRKGRDPRAVREESADCVITASRFSNPFLTPSERHPFSPQRAVSAALDHSAQQTPPRRLQPGTGRPMERRVPARQAVAQSGSLAEGQPWGGPPAGWGCQRRDLRPHDRDRAVCVQAVGADARTVFGCLKPSASPRAASRVAPRRQSLRDNGCESETREDR